jgi:hypothetical protein
LGSQGVLNQIIGANSRGDALLAFAHRIVDVFAQRRQQEIDDATLAELHVTSSGHAPSITVALSDDF